MFEPKLHIFVGQFNHFFTLRESWLHEYFIRGRRYTEVRYSHIRNLSQNWEEALEKAREAEKNMGIRLHVRESEVEQLKEIQRVSAEEKEQQRRNAEEEYRKAEEEALARRMKYWVERKQAILDKLSGIIRNDDTLEQYVDMIRDCFESSGHEFTEEMAAEAAATYNPIVSHMPEKGKMVGGAYDNLFLANVPASYLQWLVFKSGLCEVENTDFNPMAVVAQWIRDNMEIPEIKESNWVGEEGEKIESELTVDSVRDIDGVYGTTWLYKLVDADGNQFTWFASKPALKGLNKAKLKFTVKKHTIYQDVKQTVITRAKVAA